MSLSRIWSIPLEIIAIVPLKIIITALNGFQEYPGWSQPLASLGNLNGPWSIILTSSSNVDPMMSSFNGGVFAINFVSIILGKEAFVSS